jgi:aspartyl/asparaginyl-tRNA synthetase
VEAKMIGMDLNHCQVVGKGLTGKRAVDEQTLASLEILTERLERLKKLDKTFSRIEFSSAVEKLKSRRNAVAVG